MIREWIEIRNKEGATIDEIPLLAAGRGRNAERRDREIKDNDAKLRKYIREGMTPTILLKSDGKG